MAKYDIFISYSRHDAKIVHQIVSKLQKDGFSIWFDKTGIESGDAFKRIIFNAIETSDVILFFSSEGSNNSNWTTTEVGVALNENKPIIPIKLDNSKYNSEIKFDLINLDYVDLTDGNISDFQYNRLLKALKAKCTNNETVSSRDDFAKATIPNIKPMPSRGVDSCSPSYSAPSQSQAESPCPNRPYPQDIEHCPAPTTPQCQQSIQRKTYGIAESMTDSKPIAKRSIWSKLFGKQERCDKVAATAYAPADIMPYRYFIVRVFIHKPNESRKIAKSVKDVDKTAVKIANKSLEIPIKEGDKITVKLSLTDGATIDEPIQNIIWKGRYIECDFGCQLAKRNVYSVLGNVIVAINDIPKGDLKFKLDVVSVETSKVYAPVETRRYSKIFISYAHADYLQVRGIAEGCKMNGSDYFFDRHTLQAGDIFKDKILQYIDNADLFVLCWSKNAAESEWVQIERKHALELIERGNHQLAIYPLSMPPEAPLPADMSDKYNFATL